MAIPDTCSCGALIGGVRLRRLRPPSGPGQLEQRSCFVICARQRGSRNTMQLPPCQRALRSLEPSQARPVPKTRSSHHSISVPGNCTDIHKRQLNGLPIDHSVPQVCVRSASTSQLWPSHPARDVYRLPHMTLISFIYFCCRGRGLQRRRSVEDAHHQRSAKGA